MRCGIYKIRDLLRANCSDKEEDQGFHFVETKKVGLDNGYGGKSWSGYLSVLSFWGEYIPSGDGKTGWIKV